MSTPPDTYWQGVGLAAPARRALIGAGITDVHMLARWNAHDVAQLHGIGAHAMRTLRRILATAHMSFRDEVPRE